jgi:hypothetical protein
MHLWKDGKCEFCKITYDDIKNNSIEYFNKHIHHYVINVYHDAEMAANKYNEDAEYIASIKYEPEEPIIIWKKDMGTIYSLSKILDVNVVILMNIGMTEGVPFDNINNPNLQPHISIEMDLSEEGLRELDIKIYNSMHIDENVNVTKIIDEKTKILNNFKSSYQTIISYIHSVIIDYELLCNASYSLHKLNTSLTEIYTSHQTVIDKYRLKHYKYVKPKERIRDYEMKHNFYINQLCKVLLDIYNLQSGELKHFGTTFIKHEYDRVMQTESMVSKPEKYIREIETEVVTLGERYEVVDDYENDFDPFSHEGSDIIGLEESTGQDNEDVSVDDTLL